MVTIFKNIFSDEPHFISLEKALSRIKDGSSKQRIEELRNVIDKERQNTLKKDLPSVCFSGKFSERKDQFLIEHSGYLILDFDEVFDVESLKSQMSKHQFVKACWVSPRNNGVKVLVKIAKPEKHREHFAALKKEFPEVDKSGVNQSRVCYESYDPNIYINEHPSSYDKIEVEVYVSKGGGPVNDSSSVFKNICTWLINKGDAFVSGERNHFIFKLASACCRFGLDEEECISLCVQNYSIGQDGFTANECKSAVKSAYKSNKHHFGTAQFDRDELVDKKTRIEVVISDDLFDENIKPKDVIFVEDVKFEIMSLYDNGYERVSGIGVREVDDFYKMKEGEITLLTGYGNYGKSTFKAWVLLMRVLKFGEKFAFFSPENLAQEFYFDLIETLFGCDCSPNSKTRPKRDLFESACDWIGKNFFFVYPKDLSPTPEYIKQRFLELIIKEKVNGVVIDPFNQMDNDYKSLGGARDKYLEAFLSDFARFTRQNNIYGIITAHPKSPKGVEKDGNYKCPDVFDIADGAMWNNKMDNILVYHRPQRQTDPSSDVCEFHSKKIRRQKVVGRVGYSSFNYNRKRRRYLFNGNDPLEQLLIFKKLPFSMAPGVQMDAFDVFNPEEKEPLPF